MRRIILGVAIGLIVWAGTPSSSQGDEMSDVCMKAAQGQALPLTAYARCANEWERRQFQSLGAYPTYGDLLERFFDQRYNLLHDGDAGRVAPDEVSAKLSTLMSQVTSSILLREAAFASGDSGRACWPQAEAQMQRFAVFAGCTVNGNPNVPRPGN
jgi:hypothetical protein